MDRRGIFGDRRTDERRGGPAYRPANKERRSGDDRRGDERRTERGDRRRRDAGRHEPAAAAFPRIDRLLPAAVVVLASLVDLFVAQATDNKNWGLLVVVAGIPVAAFALRAPRRWRSAVWFAVGIYLTAAVVHVAYLLIR